MAKFVTFFSYDSATWNRLLAKPSDRGNAIQAAVAALSGTVESVYYMFGEYDGMVVVEVPNAADIAALSIAVASTGGFSKVETRQLIAPADMPVVLENAGRARAVYALPGD